MFDPRSAPPTTGKLLKTFVSLAVPAILTNVLFMLCSVILVIFAGQLDDPKYVAVIGLTNSFCALMILSLMIGMNAAQETLTS